MLDRHPSREQLDRYVQDELPLPQRRRVHKHVSNCSFCQRREHRLLEESSQGDVSYEAAIRRATLGVAAWLQRFQDESHHARELLAELLRDPGPEPLDRLREAPQALALRLLQMLRERCRSSWFQAPAQAIELAELEVVVAERLDEARCGSSVAADSRALAWADLGNSYRILSDFGAAEMALKKAVACQRHSGDPLTECEILGVLSSLRKHQGRYAESVASCGLMLQIARQGEDRRWEGWALMAKGTVLGDQALVEGGDLRQAIRLLRKGMARIDPISDPELMLRTQHNFLNFLNESGKSQEAEQILRRDRHLYDKTGKEAFLVGLHWLEGSIGESLGRIHEAEISLRKAREILSQQQLVLKIACISLQLGLVLCRQGQRQEALRLVEEAIPIFDTVGTYPKMAAARLLSLHLRSS
jgi:tetratricopeptide (TPR) repeat protein